MPLELFTLIALWCGNPIAGHSYTQDPAYLGPYVSVQDVNQCRNKLRTCLDKEYNKSGISIVQASMNQAADVCTKQIPYPGRDQQ